MLQYEHEESKSAVTLPPDKENYYDRQGDR
jgi:hypothetical protein